MKSFDYSLYFLYFRLTFNYLSKMKQTILTFITPIQSAKRELLNVLLQEIGSSVNTNPLIKFPLLTRLHFASLVIVDKPDVQVLVFENNFDGELSDYLDELINVAGNGLHQIYQCCTNYPGTQANAAILKQYLIRHVVRPNAYHIGNVGRSATVIRNNRELRLELQNTLDELNRNGNKQLYTPPAVLQKLQDVAVSLHPDVKHPLQSRQSPAERLLPVVKLAGAGLIGIALALKGWKVVLPLAGLALLKLRLSEERDRVDKEAVKVGQVNNLIQTENRFAQNHLANVTRIKPGWFRLHLLRGVLFAANLIARTSNKGKLSGIPSIHFAHWSIIANGRYLLFLSNYDGSWSSYLDDFIDKASKGLTGIWTNTDGFPYTRFLLWRGATDEVLFKSFARRHQVKSLVWYSAYRDLTVQIIDKDSAIREQLMNPYSSKETTQWLQLF